MHLYARAILEPYISDSDNIQSLHRDLNSRPGNTQPYALHPDSCEAFSLYSPCEEGNLVAGGLSLGVDVIHVKHGVTTLRIRKLLEKLVVCGLLAASLEHLCSPPRANSDCGVTLLGYTRLCRRRGSRAARNGRNPSLAGTPLLVHSLSKQVHGARCPVRSECKGCTAHARASTLP